MSMSSIFCMLHWNDDTQYYRGNRNTTYDASYMLVSIVPMVPSTYLFCSHTAIIVISGIPAMLRYLVVLEMTISAWSVYVCVKLGVHHQFRHQWHILISRVRKLNSQYNELDHPYLLQ